MASAGAYAQDAREQARPIDLPPIEVYGAAFQSGPYETPGSLGVIDGEELETFGQRTAGDVIRTLPGTFTRDDAQNPGIGVNIRGFEGQGRVNMMIDGVRQTFRFTGHEATGLLYVDPALLAGVDIYRGAVATSGGAGALAGTANFRTLGVEDILKRDRNVGFITSATWGSNDVRWSEMAAGAVRLNQNAAIAAAVSHRDTGNYDNGDGVSVPYTARDVRSGLVKADFSPTPDSTLKLGAVLYENEFLANSYFQTIDSKVYTAKYHYDPANPLIDFRLNFNYSNLAMDYDTNPAGAGGSRFRNITDKGIGFDTSNVARFDWGAVKVRSEFGGEWFANKVDTEFGGVNPKGKLEIGGIFSETTFSQGIFDLIAALRYDFYTLEGAGRVSSGSSPILPVGPYTVDNSDGRLNPKLTLAARVTPDVQVYATYSESMRAPTVSEGLAGGDHAGASIPGRAFTGINLYPNPFLKPEVLKGYELGTNVVKNGVWTPGDVFKFKAAFFDNDIENYIIACMTNVTPGLTGNYFCNAPGTSRVYGLELQTSYDTGRFFSSVSYTHTESNLPTQAGGFGAYSYLPDDLLTVIAGVRSHDRKLRVGGRYYYVSQGYNGGDQQPFNQGADGATSTPSYSLIDLFADYKFDSGIELSAVVTNLLDKSFTHALSTPIGFAGPTGRGRTYLLTARGKF